MGQFLGDIAFVLELLAVAAGLIVLHRAAKEAPAKLLGAAGWLLVVGGIGAALCTGWFWFRYHAHGAFDAPMPGAAPHGHRGG